MFTTESFWHVPYNRDLFVTGMNLNVHQHGSNHPLAVSLIAAPRQKVMKQ